jgi:hypothetical protein
MANDGYRGGIEVTIPIAMIIALFFGIAVYNVIEITVLIFFTFKKRKGLYFWSLLFASWGIVLHVIGFLLKFFQLCTNNYVNIVIITCGGVPMVIGQSVVLYSRLHLVVEDKRKIRWVLYMIVFGFFAFTCPPTILNFGANSPNPTPYLEPFKIYEKVMLIGFCTQECIISGLYIWETWKMLRVMKATRGDVIRRVWKHLIYVNILVILMDFTLLGIEFGGQYKIETTYKSALYSVKLKLEFAVLNQLRALVQKEKAESSCGYGSETAVRFTTSNMLTLQQNSESTMCGNNCRHLSIPSSLLSQNQKKFSPRNHVVEITGPEHGV